MRTESTINELKYEAQCALDKGQRLDVYKGRPWAKIQIGYPYGLTTHFTTKTQ